MGRGRLPQVPKEATRREKAKDRRRQKTQDTRHKTPEGRRAEPQSSEGNVQDEMIGVAKSTHRHEDPILAHYPSRTVKSQKSNHQRHHLSPITSLPKNHKKRKRKGQNETHIGSILNKMFRVLRRRHRQHPMCRFMLLRLDLRAEAVRAEVVVWADHSDYMEILARSLGFGF